MKVVKPANKKKTAKIVANTLTGKLPRQIYGHNFPKQLVKDLGLPANTVKFTLTVSAITKGAAIISCEYYIDGLNETILPKTMFKDYYLCEIE